MQMLKEASFHFLLSFAFPPPACSLGFALLGFVLARCAFGFCFASLLLPALLSACLLASPRCCRLLLAARAVLPLAVLLRFRLASLLLPALPFACPLDYSRLAHDRGISGLFPLVCALYTASFFLAYTHR